MFSYFNKEGYYKTEPASAKPIKNYGAALNVTKLNWLGISQRTALKVLFNETMLYSAVPIIKTTDFGDSSEPSNDAS